MKKYFIRLLPQPPLIFPAVLSGVLLSLCFPTMSLWMIGFVALVPMLVALVRVRPSPRDGFKTGFLFGLVFFFAMLWWVVRLIPSADLTVPWLMTPSLILMVLYLSLYPALFALLLTVSTRGRRSLVFLAAPALWVLSEMARSLGELAFPWGVAGYVLSDTPSLMQTAAFWGVEGLSFVLVLVNALVSGVFTAGRVRSRVLCAAAAAVIVAGLWGHGKTRIDGYREDTSKRIKVAVVQPNVDLAIKWKAEFRDSTFGLIERLARESAELGAEFIVFPETCAPVYIEGRDPSYKARLSALAGTLGIPIFVGFLDHRYDGPGGALNIFNSSGLFDAAGGLSKYDKNHLLPFSEQLPLSSRLRWLRKLDFGQANFQPGPRRPPVSLDGGRFTPLICFESVLAYLCRRGVNEGSELFVNITNDGWFGDTPGPIQHAQMSLPRAVEFRRYLVRCANSGLSLVVDPTGRVIAGLGLYEQGIFVVEVSLLDGKTVYARYGDLPLVIFSILIAAATAVYARRLELRADVDLEASA